MKMGGIQKKKVQDECCLSVQKKDAPVAGTEMMWWTFVASASFSVSTPASFRQTDCTASLVSACLT